MVTSRKYGAIEVGDGNFPDHSEPVFLLRAQDILAVGAIQAYLDRASEKGLPPAFLTDLRNQVREFSEWTGTRKMPD